MNDFSDIEDELKNMRPVLPSENLVTRIERSLAEAARPASAGVLSRERRSKINWLSLGLGLAAATAILLFVVVKPEQPAAKNSSIVSLTPIPVASSLSAQFVPAGLTRVVYNTRDEGLDFSSGSQRPMRRVRSMTRETLLWLNPATGASLRVSYPGEEISLISVSGQ